MVVNDFNDNVLMDTRMEETNLEENIGRRGEE